MLQNINVQGKRHKVIVLVLEHASCKANEQGRVSVYTQTFESLVVTAFTQKLLYRLGNCFQLSPCSQHCLPNPVNLGVRKHSSRMASLYKSCPKFIFCLFVPSRAENTRSCKEDKINVSKKNKKYKSPILMDIYCIMPHIAVINSYYTWREMVADFGRSYFLFENEILKPIFFPINILVFTLNRETFQLRMKFIIRMEVKERMRMEIHMDWDDSAVPTKTDVFVREKPYPL